MALVLAGLGIGLAAIVPLHDLLSHYVDEAGRLSAAVLGAVLLLMLVTGVSAVIFPALRASRIDPTRILRSE
jgi:ABC-type antimicrobial peptide transport system permease subunit